MGMRVIQMPPSRQRLGSNKLERRRKEISTSGKAIMRSISLFGEAPRLIWSGKSKVKSKTLSEYLGDLKRSEAEGDALSIAKSVAENYEDEELRDNFIEIALDLYVCQCPLLNLRSAASILTSSLL